MAYWSRRRTPDWRQAKRRRIPRSKQSSCFVPYCGEAVVTGRPEACDAGELGQAAIGAATGKDGDDVDGLRNQGTRDGDDGFLDQLLEPAQCSERGARMDGADATRMSGAPGFEQVESLRTAHFPDRNTIGSQAQR